MIRRDYSEIFEFAKNNSAFYSKKFNDIELDAVNSTDDIPITYRDEIVDNEIEVIPIKYIINSSQYKIVSERTSGSTGKFIEINWDYRDYLLSMSQLVYYRHKYYKIRPNDKRCQFYTWIDGVDGKEIVMLSKNCMAFPKAYLSNDDLKTYFEQMQTFQPVWMILQPSIAYLLAKFVIDNRIKIPASIKYIELTGEMYSKSTRLLVEEVFKCHVANQYGTYEFNSIAYECPFGNMHILDKNVIVEVVDDSENNVADGNEGKIVVTTKINKVMPFVRYCVGDSGKIEKNKGCKCGNCSEILKVTIGRSDDKVHLSSGDNVSFYDFISSMQRTDSMDAISVLQFRISQIAIDEFEVDAVIKGNKTNFETIFINNITNPELKKAKYRFRYYDSLLPDEAGKIKIFKSLVEVRK